MKHRILAAVLLLPLAASAQVYKCKTPDGHTTYQAIPCHGSNYGGQVERQPFADQSVQLAQNTPADARSSGRYMDAQERRAELERRRQEARERMNQLQKQIDQQ